MTVIANAALAVVLDELAAPSEWWAERPHEWHDVLAESADRLEWRLLPADAPARGCRFTVGPDRKTCGRPGVVQLQRGVSRRSWWTYCDLPEHLYGRVYVEGQLWQRRWIDRPS